MIKDISSKPSLYRSLCHSHRLAFVAIRLFQDNSNKGWEWSSRFVLYISLPPLRKSGPVSSCPMNCQLKKRSTAPFDLFLPDIPSDTLSEPPGKHSGTQIWCGEIVETGQGTLLRIPQKILRSSPVNTLWGSSWTRCGPETRSGDSLNRLRGPPETSYGLKRKTTFFKPSCWLCKDPLPRAGCKLL